MNEAQGGGSGLEPARGTHPLNKKKLPSLFGIWDLGFGISLASQPTKQHVHVHFLPPDANFRPDLAQFRPKTLAKWPKNLTKRKRFACKMAKKPCETQAFRMYNRPNSLGPGGSALDGWLASWPASQPVLCPGSSGLMASLSKKSQIPKRE